MTTVSDPLILRLESPQDIERIRHVTEAAFLDSDHGHHGEAGLIDRLRANDPSVLSYVAEREGQIVGHLLFSSARITGDATDRRGLGLGPVSVLPGYQRQGLGTRLIEFGLNEVRERQVDWVIVLGDPAFYRRFGFVPAAQFGVTCEFEGLPEGAFQLLPLNAKRVPSGLARYRPEFSEL